MCQGQLHAALLRWKAGKITDGWTTYSTGMHFLYIGIFSNFVDSLKYDLSEMDSWRHAQPHPLESMYSLPLILAAEYV